MDFLNNCNKILDTEFNLLKDLIVDTLSSDYKKGKKFENSIEKLSNLIHNEYLAKSYINSQTNYFEQCANILFEHKSLYNTEKVDSIYCVLSDEIKTIFSNKNKNERINRPDSDISFINYETFVTHLLKYYAAKKTANKIDGVSKYFIELMRLFYDLDDYNDFNISLLKMDVNEITFEKINKYFIKHNKVLKCVNDKTEEVKVEENNNKSFEKYENAINSLTSDEKTVLINILLNKNNGLSDAEKIKLIIISGGIKDYRIFEENSNNNLIYNKSNKGIDYPYSKNSKIDLLKSILDKIEVLNLSKTNEYLRSLLYKNNK